MGPEGTENNCGGEGPFVMAPSGEERRGVGRKNKLPPTFSGSGGMAECYYYYTQFGISNTTIVGFAAHTPHAADDVGHENGARSLERRTRL